MRFITVICVFLATSLVSAKDFKVATVDLQKLFKEYPGYEKAQKKFKTLAEKKQKELQESAQDLQDLQGEIKNSSSVLSAKQKKQKESELKQKAHELDLAENQAMTYLASKESEMTQSLLDEIKTIVAAVAKDKGADLVLDGEKTVYVNGGIDLTTDVLKSKEFKVTESDSQDESDSKKKKK